MATLDWIVEPAARPLRGVISVPGDKSISHRALLFSALAEGPSTLHGVSDGADVGATRRCLEAMGVAVRDTAEGGLVVEGQGLEALKAPREPLDCGNAGTAMRLLAGVLSAQEFDTTLVGDASLSRRPMGRVTRPLRGRGARIEGALGGPKGDETAPLTIRGLREGKRLFELEYDLPVASAQVKSALLLSGLFADGVTALREPTLSRDHTERMLAAMGVPLQVMGPVVFLDPNGWSRALQPLTLRVPGDPSAAAFFVAAGHMVEGSRVKIREVLSNLTRTGFVEVLRDQGGSTVVDPRGASGGEPLGDLHVGVRGASVLRRGARVGGELAVRCVDEIPALVAAAAVSPGTSRFDDLAELRVKESDRLAALGSMLAAFGIAHTVLADGLALEGGRPRGGAVVDSLGDHRIAMAAAILGLRAEGVTTVRDVGCVATSHPGFREALVSLGASVKEVEG
ncbi:MAG: 3-phosphoshikimate 1-carboxyvinyltransferase [Myxococcales bacterium]|nr:3-phosphoshikimate 1-carboxyvinyltransferase [Myxococcales bacterium]